MPIFTRNDTNIVARGLLPEIPLIASEEDVRKEITSVFKGKQTSKICMKFFALKLLFTMFYVTCNFLRFFTFTISEKTELE